MFFRLTTLGCKVNQYETQLVREGLLRLGYAEAGPGDTVDLVLVNTCTVTAESDWKSRKTVRKMLKEHRGAEMVVTGCAATRSPDVFASIVGVSEILTDKRDIPDFLRRRGLIDPPKGIMSFGERHRAYVKVQDGCRVGCSYCIIPKVRPIPQSRAVDEILEEVRRLVRNGYREIVLTGIHLGHYGADSDGAGASNLASLVRRIIELPEPFRLRISSLEAVEVSDELIDLMVRNPGRICEHLHLSMQSGSNAVLSRMRRRWPAETFMERCERIRERFDRLALTTDVIVGFPGETEEQFDETCRAVERLRFSKVHIFRYSPREGTEAAAFPDRIPAPVQHERAERLAELADRLRGEFAASLREKTVSVLLESPSGGTADRYLTTRLRGADESSACERESGRLVSVRVDRIEGDTLFGPIVGR